MLYRRAFHLYSSAPQTSEFIVNFTSLILFLEKNNSPSLLSFELRSLVNYYLLIGLYWRISSATSLFLLQKMKSLLYATLSVCGEKL